MEMQTNELKKAAEFGTPLYVFHEEELQETTRRFQNTLGKVAGLCYAMKANPFLVKVMDLSLIVLKYVRWESLQSARNRELPRRKFWCPVYSKKQKN